MKEYTVVTSKSEKGRYNNIDFLIKKVNEKLEEGWEVSGGILIASEQYGSFMGNDTKTIYHQVMIRN